MKNTTRVLLIAAGVFAGSTLLVTACVATTCNISSADYREKAERTDERELDLASGSRVAVRTTSGDIQVRRANGPARMRAHVVARGETLAAAQARLDRVRVIVDPSANGVTLSTEYESESASGFGRIVPTIDFEVLVPDGVHIDLVSSSGDVSAKDAAFASATLKSSYGDVQLADVTGDVVLDSSSGDVSLARARSGRVQVKTSYGDVRLESVEATEIMALTSSGEVEAKGLSAQKIGLQSNYGDVSIESSKGQLDAHTSSGDVVCRAIEGSIAADSNYGDVQVEGVVTALEATSSSGDVSVIARAGSAIGTGWKIHSNYGDVSLQAPGDARFDLSAKTGYGDVSVDYGIELAPGSSTKRKSELSGKVNGGGPQLSISSSSGDVRVTPLRN